MHEHRGTHVTICFPEEVFTKKTTFSCGHHQEDKRKTRYRLERHAFVWGATYPLPSTAGIHPFEAGVAFQAHIRLLGTHTDTKKTRWLVFQARGAAVYAVYAVYARSSPDPTGSIYREERRVRQ